MRCFTFLSFAHQKRDASEGVHILIVTRLYPLSWCTVKGLVKKSLPVKLERSIVQGICIVVNGPYKLTKSYPFHDQMQNLTPTVIAMIKCLIITLINDVVQCQIVIDAIQRIRR